MEYVFDEIAVIFEALGTLAMVVGFLIAGWLSIRSLRRGEGGSAAFTQFRTGVGSAILMGLEIMVAADLVRTVTSEPTISQVVVLGLIVLIRTVLSMSIQIEIEGVLPWKRALLESGAEVMAEQVRKDAAAQKAHHLRVDVSASRTRED